MADLLERLELLAQSDPRAALAEAVVWLRRATLAFCALLVLFCLFLYRSCQLARREGRLPPSGWWSYGALHAITGERARRLARFGQWLAGLLVLASIGFGLAVEHFSGLLLAGEPAL